MIDAVGSSRLGRIGTLRSLALILGAPLTALVWGSAISAWLPVAKPLAFAIGIHLIVPLWVALACLLPLTRNAWMAWALCLGTSVPLGVLLLMR